MPLRLTNNYVPQTFQQRIDESWNEMKEMLEEGEDPDKVDRKFPEFIKAVGEQMKVSHDEIKAEIQRFVAHKVRRDEQ